MKNNSVLLNKLAVVIVLILFVLIFCRIFTDDSANYLVISIIITICDFVLICINLILAKQGRVYKLLALYWSILFVIGIYLITQSINW